MKKVLGFLVLAALCLCLASCGKRVHIVTYNVGVFHKYTDNSTEMVASILKELKADAVSVNELDSMALRTGSVFQLERLAEAMGEGWDFNYSRAMPFNGGAYGIGTMASPKFKILARYTLPLAKYDGSEPRALSVIETPCFVLASTHLDYKSADAQLAQAKYLSAWLKENFSDSGKPVFLCGDMNATPESATISELRKDWTIISGLGVSFPSEGPNVCIDYIMALNNGEKYKVKSTGVCTAAQSADVSKASDHLPVYVDVIVR